MAIAHRTRSAHSLLSLRSLQVCPPSEVAFSQVGVAARTPISRGLSTKSKRLARCVIVTIHHNHCAVDNTQSDSNPISDDNNSARWVTLAPYIEDLPCGVEDSRCHHECLPGRPDAAGCEMSEWIAKKIPSASTLRPAAS